MTEFEVTRRNFVLGSLAAGALPLGAGANARDLRQSGLGGQPPRLHKLLVDRTLPESVRLGSYAGALADEVFVFDGDLTSLWNNELRFQWPSGPRPIAGLTTPAVRMVLEQLGRDHDARIVFSAEHRRVAGGMQHSLAGCDALLGNAEFRGSADWVADMARHIAACPHERRSKAALQYETGDAAGLSGGQPRLVTWVLAPISPRDQRHNSETVNS